MPRTLLLGLTLAGIVAPARGVPPKWQLGHWVSADGMVGYTIDRTGAKAKVRADGSREILELTSQEDRDRQDKLLGYRFLAPDGSRLLYLSPEGRWSALRGKDELPLQRDAGASPLPAATRTGTPAAAPERPASERLAAQLRAVAVRGRWTEYGPEDSGNLDKVAQVLARVEPAMLVTYLADPSRSPHWEPASARIGLNEYSGLSGFYPANRPWDPKRGGLERFGGILAGASSYGSRNNHLQLRQPEGWPPALAEHTPGIVWELDGASVVFVTLDGGRYRIDLGSGERASRPVFAPGLAPLPQWPAPLQHSLLGPEQVDFLARAGILPLKTCQDLQALDAGWDACVQQAWLGAKPELDALERAGLDATAREARSRAIQEHWAAEVDRQAAPWVAKSEAALLALIDARDRQRLAIYEQAKRRLGGAGVAPLGVEAEHVVHP
jgi:hypothetical protein